MKEHLVIHSVHGDSRITLETQAFKKLAAYLKKLHAGAQVAVITDGNVGPLFHDRIRKHLPEATLLVVPPGEGSKKMAMAEALCSDLLKEGFTRDSVIVGLGGGMITDLAGFVASIFMRGIAYIAMPTTLLAMVDAAVGGKTALNLEAKNVLGTIYPAELILIDLDFLKTLPEREKKTGVAEAIKIAATLDADLEKHLIADRVDFVDILERTLKAKVDICNQDLKERGARKVLNFGHTFGHAIEFLSRYELSHGEAISIGMVLANKVAQNLGKQTEKHGKRVKTMLQKYGLPTILPKNLSLKKIIELVHHDKKMEGDFIHFIISRGMGKHEIIRLKPEELTSLVK